MGLLFAAAMYGVILSVLGFLSAGYGHGVFFPIGVSSAPLGFLVPATRFVAGGRPSELAMMVTLFGTPVLWAGVARLLARTPFVVRSFVAVMVLHYASALALLFTETFGYLEHLRQFHRAAPWVLPSWALIYLAGQTALWVMFTRRVQGRHR